MDRKSLQTIYVSIIGPLLDYADVVWDNCTQQQINELEKIQIEAGRIILGTIKLVAIVVPVLGLLFVALWFILQGDLLYVFPCVSFCSCVFQSF